MPQINTALIHDYLQLVLRRKWLVLGVFAAFVATIAIFTFRQPRLYQAATTIEIGVEIPDVAFFKEVVSVNPTNWWSIGRYYETQYKIIKSTAILSKVSKRLIEEKVWPAKPGVSDEQAYLARLRGGVSATPVGESRLARIGFRDTDPRTIARVCNVIAQVYVEENLNRKLVSARQAVQWLSQQMDSFQGEKQASEEELQQFKEKYRIVSAENPAEIMKSNLRGLSETLNDLVKERIKLEARYKQLNQLVAQSKNVDDLFGLVESDLLKKLKADYVDQDRNFLVLSVRYKSKHPEIVRAKKELAQLRRKVDMEVNNEVQRLKSRFLLAKAEEDRVRDELEAKKLEALEFDRVSFQLENIKRVADTNQKFFLALNEKLKEADLSGLVKSNNIRVIDYATTPTRPVAPNVQLNLILAIILGLMGGIGSVIVVDYLDATFQSQADVEKLFGASFLGAIPLIGSSQETVVENGDEGSTDRPSCIEYLPLEFPNSNAAELYRTIRTNLSFVTSQNDEKLLLFTSTGPKEGKSATSLNLAITLAKLGQRVLLLDGDLRRPSVHKVFDLKTKVGFSSLLINAVSIDEAIQQTAIEHLDILPAGPIPPNPSELLSSERTDAIFAELRGRYDKILVDGTPTLFISDALVLSQKVDGVIFVVRAGVPHRNVVTRAKSQLENVGARIIGCILNGVSQENMDITDRYYYRYGYYRYQETNADESRDPQLRT